MFCAYKATSVEFILFLVPLSKRDMDKVSIMDGQGASAKMGSAIHLFIHSSVLLWSFTRQVLSSFYELEIQK